MTTKVTSIQSPYRRPKELMRLSSPKSPLSEDLSATESTTDRSMDYYGMMLPAHLMKGSENNTSGVIPESEDESYSSSVFSSSEAESESTLLNSETETSDVDFVLHGYDGMPTKDHNQKRRKSTTKSRKERSRSDGSKREGRSFSLLRRRKATETESSLHSRSTTPISDESNPKQEGRLNKALQKLRIKEPNSKELEKPRIKKSSASRRQNARSKSAPEASPKLLEKLSVKSKKSSSSRRKERSSLSGNLSPHTPLSPTRTLQSRTADHEEDTEPESPTSFPDSQTQLFLEQRKRERAARLEKVRERIRLQKEQSDAHKRAQELRPRGSTQERMTEAYQWYIRCGLPSRTVMKQRLCWEEQSCGLTVEDIDLLPWTKGGGRVSARKYLLLTAASSSTTAADSSP